MRTRSPRPAHYRAIAERRGQLRDAARDRLALAKGFRISGPPTRMHKRGTFARRVEPLHPRTQPDAEPVEPSLSGSRVYRAHPETAPSGKTLVALPISLVHSFVELNRKHTDTGIEPGTPNFDLTAPAPLHQWCVPVKKRSNETLPVLTPGICRL